MIIKQTWTQIKSLTASKQLNLQYEELQKDYHIWLQEGNDTYSCYMQIDDPASADQLDFETNYKPTANQPLVKKTTDGVEYIRATAKTVGLMMRLHGNNFNAAPNTTTKSQFTLPYNMEIVGAIFRVVGANPDDRVNMNIVDVDNILGYGANTILAQFAIDVPGELCEDTISVESTTSDIVYSGLYLSMEYVNSGDTDVEVYYAYKYYK